MLDRPKDADIARRLLTNEDFRDYQQWLKDEYEKFKNNLADHASSSDKTDTGTVNKYGGKLEAMKWVINLPAYKREAGNREEKT